MTVIVRMTAVGLLIFIIFRKKLKRTFVHLTYCPSRQQLPDATNLPKGIMTLRHMCSTGALHMVGSNEQHVQGCSSVRQTVVHCFTEWVGGLFSSLCFPFFINSILFTKKSVVIVNNLAIEWPRISAWCFNTADFFVEYIKVRNT